MYSPFSSLPLCVSLSLCVSPPLLTEPPDWLNESAAPSAATTINRHKTEAQTETQQQQQHQQQKQHQPQQQQQRVNIDLTSIQCESISIGVSSGRSSSSLSSVSSSSVDTNLIRSDSFSTDPIRDAALRLMTCPSNMVPSNTRALTNIQLAKAIQSNTNTMQTRGEQAHTTISTQPTPTKSTRRPGPESHPPNWHTSDVANDDPTRGRVDLTNGSSPLTVSLTSGSSRNMRLSQPSRVAPPSTLVSTRRITLSALMNGRPLAHDSLVDDDPRKRTRVSAVDSIEDDSVSKRQRVSSDSVGRKAIRPLRLSKAPSPSEKLKRSIEFEQIPPAMRPTNNIQTHQPTSGHPATPGNSYPELNRNAAVLDLYGRKPPPQHTPNRQSAVTPRVVTNPPQSPLFPASSSFPVAGLSSSSFMVSTPLPSHYLARMKPPSTQLWCQLCGETLGSDLTGERHIAQAQHIAKQRRYQQEQQEASNQACSQSLGATKSGGHEGAFFATPPALPPPLMPSGQRMASRVNARPIPSHDSMASVPPSLHQFVQRTLKDDSSSMRWAYCCVFDSCRVEFDERFLSNSLLAHLRRVHPNMAATHLPTNMLTPNRLTPSGTHTMLTSTPATPTPTPMRSIGNTTQRARTTPGIRMTAQATRMTTPGIRVKPQVH